jgi:adaptin ear-binding coat-associated protein 1/2
MSSTEQRRLSLNEVFVYKVPPLRTASGHRAEEWGLADPLFTGHMRVFQADTLLRIVLFAFRDPTTLMTADENLVLFGECPVEVKPSTDITTFVDSVIDSSRYFVLRLKDPKSSRTTNIGIGFRERDVAFDFKNCLNEYVRYIDRMAKAEEMHTSAVDQEVCAAFVCVVSLFSLLLFCFLFSLFNDD